MNKKLKLKTVSRGVRFSPELDQWLHKKASERKSSFNAIVYSICEEARRREK